MTAPSIHKKKEEYIYFFKDISIYSPWYPAKFRTGSVVEEKRDEAEFDNVMQYVMAEKALMFKDLYIYNLIMWVKHPLICEKLGKQIKDFNKNVWDKKKEDIVYHATLEKFRQNPELKAYLLGTKDKCLVYAHPKDTVWGVGLSESDPRIKDKNCWGGENKMGQLLNLARTVLDNKKNKSTKLTESKLSGLMNGCNTTLEQKEREEICRIIDEYERNKLFNLLSEV